jgi:hypothetical protein
MNMATIQPLSYSGYRFPAAIISRCTWFYFQREPRRDVHGRERLDKS